MAKVNLNFYSFHDCVGTPSAADCTSCKERKPDIKYPCIILIRYNNWNDYTYRSHFETFFLPKKDTMTRLGEIMIIQSKAKDNDTVLSNEFEILPKKEYFSRGTFSFYKKFETLKEIKNEVLAALNDIHYHPYTKEYIAKVDPELAKPWDLSLFRYNVNELDVSSQYARNSLDVLDKIRSCVESLPKLDEDNQKIIRKLLFGSVITALESYLGDAFKYHVINNKNYFYSFLQNYEFPKGDKKYDLKELGLQGSKIAEFIENRVKEIMNNILFHNVVLVTELYKDILNIDLQSSIMDFREAIQKRHDIFHRNGRNIAGIELDIQSAEIIALIDQAKKFICETERIIAAQT